MAGMKDKLGDTPFEPTPLRAFDGEFLEAPFLEDGDAVNASRAGYSAIDWCRRQIGGDGWKRQS